MRINKSFIIAFWGIIILFGFLSVSAQDIPAKPDPPRLVNDFAGILTPEEVQTLENKLVRFNDSTSTQIVVVIVKSLNGLDKNDFAYKIGQTWGVGQKGKNNGAVMLVKPKYPNEKGEACIQTGYGLEGAIPDALAKRIYENEMLPNFRTGNYYAGIDAATSAMISLVKGEFTADQYANKGKKSSPYALIIPLIILIIVFTTISSSRGRGTSVGKSLPFWTALMLMGSMGRGHSGSWSDFSGGGGGFGGGGGGGFGGFGGGSFGGGGAGGSW